MLRVYKGLFKFPNPKPYWDDADKDIPANYRLGLVSFTVKWDGHPARVRELLNDEFSARFGDVSPRKLLTIQKVVG